MSPLGQTGESQVTRIEVAVGDVAFRFSTAVGSNEKKVE